MLQQLHSRLGDFWWYSLIIFAACRSGDAIQAFIGLWLVPKYVGPTELGAVLPLQQLTSFLTVPLAVLSTVFAKYVSVYTTRGEYGKVKGFIRDVFAATAVLFALCIGGAYLIMPFFYERLRITSGSLTVLILLCGLAANVNTVVTSAQQGLKRFKTLSAMNVIGAPIRLVTLLVAMPFRPLSGYLLGQTTPAATASFLSVLDIRKALKGHAPDATWRRDLPEIGRYLAPFAVYTLFGSLAGALTATVYRQRLPEVESAAYYMLTRFSDMVGFISASFTLILFPLASEAHERGRENRRLLWHSVLATLGGGILLALAFALAARTLFALTDAWRTYLPYIHLLPILTISNGAGLSAGVIANYELACGRFGALVLMVLLNLAYAALLIVFTGYDAFRGLAPDALVDWVKSLNVASLPTITGLSLAFGLLLLSTMSAFTVCQTKGRHP